MIGASNLHYTSDSTFKEYSIKYMFVPDMFNILQTIVSDLADNHMLDFDIAQNFFEFLPNDFTDEKTWHKALLDKFAQFQYQFNNKNIVKKKIEESNVNTAPHIMTNNAFHTELKTKPFSLNLSGTPKPVRISPTYYNINTVHLLSNSNDEQQRVIEPETKKSAVEASSTIPLFNLVTLIFNPLYDELYYFAAKHLSDFSEKDFAEEISYLIKIGALIKTDIVSFSDTPIEPNSYDRSLESFTKLFYDIIFNGTTSTKSLSESLIAPSHDTVMIGLNTQFKNKEELASLKNITVNMSFYYMNTLYMYMLYKMISKRIEIHDSMVTEISTNRNTFKQYVPINILNALYDHEEAKDFLLQNLKRDLTNYGKDISPAQLLLQSSAIKIVELLNLHPLFYCSYHETVSHALMARGSGWLEDKELIGYGLHVILTILYIYFIQKK